MMKKIFSLKIVLVFIIINLSQFCTSQNVEEEFSFIVISDQRAHATEEYHSKEYTLGGFEAIKNVGQGEFVIVNGDLDPPQATRKLLDKVLGENYPWYTVIGNHDIENDENMEYMRNLNRNGNTFANIVKRGPKGCEETTYSFDYYNVHFVVINLYYDGEKDNILDGVVSSELLAWLEYDLKQNDKKYTLVFGHEPIRPVMDLDNGTVRHLGDALDQYYEETILFERILHKYDVDAYFSGHTHCASYANYNGLWLINSGHIYGQESDFTPEKLYSKISLEIAKEENEGKLYQNVIKDMYHRNWKEYKKLIFNLGYGDGWNYKNIPDDETLSHLYKFYDDCKDNEEKLKNYMNLFWKNTEWRQSSFLKIRISSDAAILEIYRDIDFTGNYTLRHSQVLY
ncbi:MAG: metallophosphoesterase [Ignavibacteriaceae bacterium]|nr:metallophosphoesterase [Ignavibacteriaceae bacterium]